MQPPPNKTDCRAFTLLELLVVVGIIIVLAALLLPALKNAMTTALGARCISQLKSDGAGALLYASDHNNLLPINRAPDSAGNESQYYILIGPYVATPPKSGSAPFYRALPSFRCPNFQRTPGAQYLYQYNGIIGGEPATSFGAVKQPGSTPLMWDISGQSDSINGYEANPNATNYGYKGPTSLSGLSPNHGRCCNMLFVSGNVRPVSLSDFSNFPWYGKAPAKNGVGTVFDPAYPDK